jgi:hypothetical protein
MTIPKSYEIHGFSVENIRNRNELRVAEILRQELRLLGGFCGCRVCIEDCYAAALNSIPPHYAQMGSIVIQQQPDEELLRAEVRQAIERVRAHPKHPADPLPGANA